MQGFHVHEVALPATETTVEEADVVQDDVSVSWPEDTPESVHELHAMAELNITDDGPSTSSPTGADSEAADVPKRGLLSDLLHMGKKKTKRGATVPTSSTQSTTGQVNALASSGGSIVIAISKSSKRLLGRYDLVPQAVSSSSATSATTALAGVSMGCSAPVSVAIGQAYGVLVYKNAIYATHADGQVHKWNLATCAAMDSYSFLPAPPSGYSITDVQKFGNYLLAVVPGSGLYSLNMDDTSVSSLTQVTGGFPTSTTNIAVAGTKLFALNNNSITGCDLTTLPSTVCTAYNVTLPASTAPTTSLVTNGWQLFTGNSVYAFDQSKNALTLMRSDAPAAYPKVPLYASLNSVWYNVPGQGLYQEAVSDGTLLRTTTPLVSSSGFTVATSVGNFMVTGEAQQNYISFPMIGADASSTSTVQTGADASSQVTVGQVVLLATLIPLLILAILLALWALCVAKRSARRREEETSESSKDTLLGSKWSIFEVKRKLRRKSNGDSHSHTASSILTAEELYRDLPNPHRLEPRTETVRVSNEKLNAYQAAPESIRRESALH